MIFSQFSVAIYHGNRNDVENVMFPKIFYFFISCILIDIFESRFFLNIFFHAYLVVKMRSRNI